MLIDSDSFPFRGYVSLQPLIEYWRSMVAAETGAAGSLARDVLRLIELTPALLESHSDAAALAPHADLVGVLMTAAFPPYFGRELSGAALAPFRYGPIYQTQAMRQSGLLDRLTHLPVPLRDELDQRRTMNAYHLILNRAYGADIKADYTLEFPLEGEEGEVIRWLRARFDPAFCSFRLTGPLPELSPDQIESLLARRMDLELWSAHLPPDLFEFHGIVLVRASDATEQHILSAIKSDLLQRGALTHLSHLTRLQSRFRALLHCPDLDLGLISMEYGEFNVLDGMVAVGRSLLLSEGGAPACPDAADSIYGSAVGSEHPIIVYDLERLERLTAYERHLLASGYRNVFLAPLKADDRVVGLLELGSRRPGDLHELNTVAAKEVTDLFATTLQRSLDEREDRVQAAIKEHYTAIHPVVEWRFRQVARDYLRRLDSAQRNSELEDAGRKPNIFVEPIGFRDVYPLYGVSDIRSSSTQRNLAIREDLVDQLGLALNILVAAGAERWMPALDELGFRITTFAQEVSANGLSAGDDVRVLEFLHRDLEPLLDQLKAFGPKTRERVEAYQAALDPDLRVVYRKRKAFEESVARINETISSYIARQESLAQAIVPHYFEKYKTDGVEYNIFAGASMVEGGDFSTLHLHSLRLWQLMLMCGVVWELEAIREELSIPLEVTHLVLLHNNPLKIRFRIDEKKFDVDGAYHIRYEIVKKRIDKATIRPSGERLTRPGEIAVVYEHERDAAECRRYIEYLQAAHYVEDQVEEVTLNELQGVTGLRALRLKVRSAFAGEDATDIAPIEALQRGLAAAGTPVRSGRQRGGVSEHRST